MDTVTIVVLTVVIAVLAGVLAWYGPRRRNWQTHRKQTPDDGDRPTGGEDGPDDQSA